MKTAMEKSGSLVASLFQEPRNFRTAGDPVHSGPAITIAHQTGSGAHEIAGQLANILQGAEPKGAPPWTVLDRQIVEKALEEHHWPKALAQKMPEDRRSLFGQFLNRAT